MGKIAPISGGVCDCVEGYFDSAGETTPENYCQPCQRYCAKCESTPENCKTCMDYIGVSLVGSTCVCTAADGNCNNCPAGSYGKATSEKTTGFECVSCPAGMYQDEKGATQCKPCPAGSASSSPGQALCQSCVPGTYQNETGKTLCLYCLPGQFQSSSGSTSCSECEPGLYASTSGLSRCTACPKGSCQSQKGAVSCSGCPAGTYQSFQGKSRCERCPMGTYSGVANLTSSDGCLPCPAGKYGPNAGLYACIVCSPGTYNTDPGKMSATACVSCPANTYSPLWGRNVTCEPCPNRSTSLEGATVCTCDRGAYFAGRAEGEYCPGIKSRDNGMSVACNKFCSECAGGASNCSSCVDNARLGAEGSGCLCDTANGFYIKESECRPCYKLCLTCHGSAMSECDSFSYTYSVFDS